MYGGLRLRNIVRVSSSVEDWKMQFEEMNDANSMVKMRSNDSEKGRENSTLNVGTNVGRQTGYQLEPFLRLSHLLDPRVY